MKIISQAGLFNTPGTARGVVVQNGYAYVCDTASGIRKLSVGNPADIASMAVYDPGATNAKGTHVYGEYVYLAYDNLGLYVLNTDLSLLGTFNSPGLAQHVFAVDPAHVFLADNTGGLVALDCSNPGAISEYSTLATTGALFLFVENEIAYLADNAGGLRIIDVSDPTAMTILSTTACGGATGLCKSGNRVYVSSTNGLYVFDVVNPASPTLLGTIGSGENFNRIATDGTLIFAATDGGNFRTYDVSDPTSSILIASFTTTASTTHDIHYSNGFVYYADGTAGLIVYKVEEARVRTGWITRRLNHVSDDGEKASLQSNRIVLAPGTYIFRISAPGCGCGRHQTRLMNMSNQRAVLGTIEAVNAESQLQSRSFIRGVLVVRAGDRFEIQHTCSSPRQIYGLGRASDNQDSAIYTVAEFWYNTEVSGSCKIPPIRGFNVEQTKWLEELKEEVKALNSRTGTGYVRFDDRRDPGVQGGGFSA